MTVHEYAASLAPRYPVARRGEKGRILDDIYIANADGSAQTRLTNDPAPDRAPAWSPDSTRIAFESFREGKSEVFVVNADGSGLTSLSAGR